MEDMTEGQKALYAAVRTEVESVSRVVEAFGDALRAHEAKAPESAKSAHADAKSIWDDAKRLHDAEQYREAYDLARKAFETVSPAIGELLDKPHPPESLINVVSDVVQQTADRLNRLEEHVTANNEGRDAYNKASDIYRGAKDLWVAGKRRQAFEEYGQALRQLDRAIHANWPRATGG